MLNKISYQSSFFEKCWTPVPRRQRPSALPMPKVLEASERVEKVWSRNPADLGGMDLAVTSSILPGLDSPVSHGEAKIWALFPNKEYGSQRQKVGAQYQQSLLRKELLIFSPMAENCTESSAIGKHRDDT